MVFEDDIGQKDAAAPAEQGEQVENIVDVIVNSIAQIAARADPTSQIAEGAGQERKCAEFLPEKVLVYMHQNHIIRVGAENFEHSVIPRRSPKDNVIVQQHEISAAGDTVTGRVQFAQRQTRLHYHFSDVQSGVFELERRLVIAVDNENDLELSGMPGMGANAVAQSRQCLGSAASGDNEGKRELRHKPILRICRRAGSATFVPYAPKPVR
jgi:hypothetical protein